MAVFSTSYFDRYALDFDELASIPDDVLDSMIEAEAEIIKEGQAQSAATMLQGPYYQGGIVRSLKIGKVKRSRDGREVFVTFEGTQHGNRVAEIAFVNEFGKQGQPARPFIREANEKNSDKAVDAAAKIYDQYLKSKGF